MFYLVILLTYQKFVKIVMFEATQVDRDSSEWNLVFQ